ncbi:NUDIX domain-containing protein [Acidianus sulfidivorans JP7]|uniref:DNA mismatch repair protein MutT n=1 Tax=Acidianus sulfidivorans JP7 TaxID=619593 RepID=A0A2U9IM69_9CREN|nr:NUDIX hydrolase [Acidianus sulfidivorans]AWR97014.1 NUDIX domain-containing protein [Acidianus sulfidivorans JP7]
MNRPLVAVGGVIIDDNKVLLIKRSKPPNQGDWAIPGGKVEYGESIFDAVKREMKEETNLDVIPVELLAVVQIIKEGFHYIILDFVCKVNSGELKASSDALDARFFSMEEIRKLQVSPTTLDMLEKYFSKKEKLPLFIIDKE